jgi:hypothetical protein
LYNTNYRIYKENQILQHIKDIAPKSYIAINMRASGVFYSATDLHGEVTQAKDIRLTDVSKLKKPTWHMNNDWL